MTRTLLVFLINTRFSSDFDIDTDLDLYLTCQGLLLFGNETRITSQQQRNSFATSCYRVMLNVTWVVYLVNVPDRVTNAEIYRRINQKLLSVDHSNKAV